jgi:hypothetical protein
VSIFAWVYCAKVLRSFVTNNKLKLGSESCALSITADINMLDVFEDSLAVLNAFNNFADNNT